MDSDFEAGTNRILMDDSGFVRLQIEPTE